MVGRATIVSRSIPIIVTPVHAGRKRPPPLTLPRRQGWRRRRPADRSPTSADATEGPRSTRHDNDVHRCHHLCMGIVRRRTLIMVLGNRDRPTSVRVISHPFDTATNEGVPSVGTCGRRRRRGTCGRRRRRGTRRRLRGMAAALPPVSWDAPRRFRTPIAPTGNVGDHATSGPPRLVPSSSSSRRG
jgi:hypothetical protein